MNVNIGDINIVTVDYLKTIPDPVVAYQEALANLAHARGFLAQLKSIKADVDSSCLLVKGEIGKLDAYLKAKKHQFRTVQTLQEARAGIKHAQIRASVNVAKTKIRDEQDYVPEITEMLRMNPHEIAEELYNVAAGIGKSFNRVEYIGGEEDMEHFIEEGGMYVEGEREGEGEGREEVKE